MAHRVNSPISLSEILPPGGHGPKAMCVSRAGVADQHGAVCLVLAGDTATLDAREGAHAADAQADAVVVARVDGDVLLDVVADDGDQHDGLLGWAVWSKSNAIQRVRQSIDSVFVSWIGRL